MRTYRYLHYDVFTDVPFEGNQLAVFPEPAGLSTEEMQTITREMNFSECTFIFPPDLPHVTAGSPQATGAKPIDVRMRIFTPGEELPMAGHPTIGSTFALAGNAATLLPPARRAMPRVFTAACWPPASASPRIPRPAVRAGRSAATCSSTTSSPVSACHTSSASRA